MLLARTEPVAETAVAPCVGCCSALAARACGAGAPIYGDDLATTRLTLRTSGTSRTTNLALRLTLWTSGTTTARAVLRR